MDKSLNLTMQTDFYQLTMMYGYFKQGVAHRRAVYDLFFREAPWGNGYAIAAGLEQAVDFIQNLHFTGADLEYLRSLGTFDEDFIRELARFRFTGDVWAVPEGTVVFGNEPILRVEGPIFEAQLIETMLLTIINHQTLIATKAARVKEAAGDDPVLEFGLRRAQGPDAGFYGARAAVIGGCDATSNVLAGQMLKVPIKGTHAHSWVMTFDTELEAFRAYAEAFPDSCLLLVDTYDTLRSGIPNAIQVAKELREKGYHFVGIRLDSGDLAYLSKQARKSLNEAGFQDAIIVASNELDETVIASLKMQGAEIDVWGVGTRLITGYENPALGGVYKLSALERNGVLEPKLKISNNAQKTTNPGKKRVVRFIGRDHGHALADLIVLDSERVEEDKPLTIFDPVDTWKRKTLENFRIRDLLEPIFINGELVYNLPSLDEIVQYRKREVATLWPEYRRLTNPQTYHVDLSEKLWTLKDRMIREIRLGHAPSRPHTMGHPGTDQR